MAHTKSSAFYKGRSSATRMNLEGIMMLSKWQIQKNPPRGGCRGGSLINSPGWVWFPESTWQFTTGQNFSSRKSDTLFWPPHTLYTHGTFTCMHVKHSYTLMNINLLKYDCRSTCSRGIRSTKMLAGERQSEQLWPIRCRVSILEAEKFGDIKVLNNSESYS